MLSFEVRLLRWVHSVGVPPGPRQVRGLGRSEREGGASVVEWVIICALVVTVAAILSAVIVRELVSTANTVRTQ